MRKKSAHFSYSYVAEKGIATGTHELRETPVLCRKAYLYLMTKVLKPTPLIEATQIAGVS